MTRTRRASTSRIRGGQLLGRYVERYVYDDVDGLLELGHRSDDPAHLVA
jgi:hypothetical protein